MAVWQKQLVRHAVAVRAGVIALFAVGLLAFAIIPLFGRISELNSKIGVREKEAADIANRVAVLSGLDREILKSRVEILDKALPPKKDVLLYLSAIDGLSRELGLNFQGIALSPGDVTEATASASATGRRAKIVKDEVPGVHSLETDVKITGQQDSIFAFLRSIEQALPLMQVKGVKIASSADDSLILSLRLGMLWASGNLANVKGAITLFNEKEETYFQQLAGYRVYLPVTAQEAGLGGTGKADLFAPALVVEPQPVEINQIEIEPELGSETTPEASVTSQPR